MPGGMGGWRERSHLLPEKTIKPAIAANTGLASELAMVVTENNDWAIHDECRHSDKPILKPKCPEANDAQC